MRKDLILPRMVLVVSQTEIDKIYKFKTKES